MDFILSLFAGGNSMFVGLGGIVAVLVAIFFKGRKSERDRQAADRLKARSEADRIDDAVAGRDADANRARLKRWTPWGKQ